MNQNTLKIIEEAVKYVAQYIIPIAAFILSIVSLQKSRKVSALEKKLNEYDAIIKEHEVEKINAKPEAVLDARITKISKNSYKLYVFNKGNANAYDVDYEINKDSSIVMMKQVTPFEVMDPGGHFEEPVIVYMGSGPKYKITLTWKDEDKQPHSKELIKSIE